MHAVPHPMLFAGSTNRDMSARHDPCDLGTSSRCHAPRHTHAECNGNASKPFGTVASQADGLRRKRTRGSALKGVAESAVARDNRRLFYVRGAIIESFGAAVVEGSSIPRVVRGGARGRRQKHRQREKKYQPRLHVPRASTELAKERAP
jgi:hypothetical protein